MDWLSIAKELPVSHSRRVNCWKCGGKKTASITNMGKYYAVNCFRCKETETKDPPPMTPQERLALRRAAEAFEASPPTLPDDFTHDIPMEGLLWLSKGGLHVDDIKKHGFGWSNRIKRVIMPVWDDNGTLVGVQARNTGSAFGPKYLGQVWDGPRPVFAALGPKRNREADNVLVLTEDILSACRVSKVCTAWALLGTNLMPAVVERIASSEFDDIVVWMDDDEAGISARRRMLRELGAVGIKARAVLSDRDPKHHTLDEMRGLIYWHTTST